MLKELRDINTNLIKMQLTMSEIASQQNILLKHQFSDIEPETSSDLRPIAEVMDEYEASGNASEVFVHNKIRVINRFYRAGLMTMEDLKLTNVRELKKLRDFGQNSLTALQEFANAENIEIPTERGKDPYKIFAKGDTVVVLCDNDGVKKNAILKIIDVFEPERQRYIRRLIHNYLCSDGKNTATFTPSQVKTLL